MALHQRLDYGSNVYEVPSMPQVPRSARGKRSMRRKVDDNQMSAFDMLATVAGKLLSEGECPMDLHDRAAEMVNLRMLGDPIKGEQSSEEKSIKTETFDQHSCNGTAPGPEIIPIKVPCELKEGPWITKTSISGDDSDFMKSNKSHATDIAKESNILNNNCEIGNGVAATTEKRDTWNKSSSSAESHEPKGDWIKTLHQMEQRKTENLLESKKSNLHFVEDPMDLDIKPPALISSDCRAEAPFYRNNNRHISCISKCDEMELVLDKDDDERSSACTHSSTLSHKDSKLQRIGDRRIRKLLSSKYWKSAPKMSRDGEFSNCNANLKPALRGKKMCYTRQRTHRATFKRRKLFENSTLSPSAERTFSEVLSNICEKGSVKVEGSSLHSRRATGASSSSSGQKLSYESPDCHVRLSIKSFKVPELFIEIPENATVASLKRTVVETVTAILGGGLRVGVLLQGKKVRDDNKTLLQAGIFHGDKHENLGFTLEPNTTEAPPSLMSSEDPSFLDAVEPLARIPPVDSPTNQATSNSSHQHLVTSCPESDDSSHTPAETSTQDTSIINSRALVVVPSPNVEPLAVVPLRKSKRSEVVQRRIRRPFTVAEVEALVQAVEKLGTGRWRDVKLRAFDNAKHRTYVDLKDKWKTLVHTARISPQQRRGEPVPQELLDRVLSAHAYWSQQQAKLQVKSSPQAETCLLL